MSDSYARGGQSRSVPDPDGKACEEMIRRHKTLMTQKEAKAMGASRNAASPSLTSIDAAAGRIAHVLSGAQEARHEFEDGHKIRALVDGVTAAADITWAGIAANGLRKGSLKIKRPFTWRTKPWEEGRGAREWMGDKGIVEKGQHAHHALTPNKGWGKYIPDAIKNQPANIKPTDTPLTHTRIHSASRKAGLPRFNPVERYWHGTPTWWKAANGAALGHATQIGMDHLPRHPSVAPPHHNPRGPKK